MKQERNFPKFVVTKKGVRWLESGHPWVYESDICAGPILPQGNADGNFSETPVATATGASACGCENGCLADVVSENGKYMGTGLVSLKSKIRVRLLSRNANERFDEAFWRRRVEYAWNYRKTVMGDNLDCFRLIFGESDGFPGLTVDFFHDLLVSQTLSVGMEKLKPVIFPLIVETLQKDGVKVRGFYERNDVAIRELEGLEQGKGWFKLPKETADGGVAESAAPVLGAPDAAAGQDASVLLSPITEICENGIYYYVDVENGQKTGFFLDQKFNRRAVASIAKGKRVLDCFTHTGSFAMNAALGGAQHVTAVDISASAIEMARKNAERNNLTERMDFLVADVFDLLPNLKAHGSSFYGVNDGKPYDFIILDPPAFTKSRKTADNAEKGYKEINLQALRLLPRGGYFATASCSHFMPCERFEKMLHEAASEAGVELKAIEVRGAAPDHPVLWNVPETEYLKFYLFQVV